MKTSRNYLYVAALLLAATFTACSSDGDIASENVTPQPDQPATGKEVILTGTLADKGGEETRSLDDDGKTEWYDGEEIAIYYEKTDGTFATATATIQNKDIDYSSGFHTTSYTAKLTDPKNGTNVKLVYPASMHNGTGGYSTENLLTKQKGTINDISDNWDLATGQGIMTVSGSKATLPTVTMKNELCICKFTFDGVPAEDFDYAVRPSINDGTHEYKINKIQANSIYYVAMLPTIRSTFTFCANSPTMPYQKSDGTLRAAKGQWFSATGIAKENLTTEHVGCVFDENLDVYRIIPQEERTTLWFKKTVNNVTLEAGKFYNVPITLTCGADLDPEIKPVAVITYVGTQTGHDIKDKPTEWRHGLAMALFDADGEECKAENNYDAVTTYQWKTSTGSLDNQDFQITAEADFGKQYDGDAISSNPYTDGGVLTWYHCDVEQKADDYPAFQAAWNYANICGFDPSTEGATPWYLPSAFQWQQMVEACNSYLPTNLYNIPNLPRLMYAPKFGEGSQLARNMYWSSTEYDATYAWSWSYTMGDNLGQQWGNPSWHHSYTKEYKRAVRAIFGF